MGDGLEFLGRGFGLPRGGGAGFGQGFGVWLAALAHLLEGGLVETGGGAGVATEASDGLATDAGFGGAFHAVDGAQHVGDGEGGEPGVGGVEGVEGGKLPTGVEEYLGATLGGGGLIGGEGVFEGGLEDAGEIVGGGEGSVRSLDVHGGGLFGG